jgi:hypothetical protein
LQVKTRNRCHVFVYEEPWQTTLHSTDFWQLRELLAESGQAMSCQELIAAMVAKNYWSSPKGRTPAATLYACFLREMKTKGEKARMVKTARGKFALRPSM